MNCDVQDQCEEVYKTKLSDGRYFVVTSSQDLSTREYIITVNSTPVYSSKLPVLLRQQIDKIQLFSCVENKYLKTEISIADTKTIQRLIGSTSLNRFNLLFGHFITED